MAEGGIFSSTSEGGSDFLFDHKGSECHDPGSAEEAMKTHALESVTSVKQTKSTLPTVCPVQIVAKCYYHPDRDIEMFCGTHDMVYCSLCVARDHRSCENVQEINKGVHRTELSTLEALVTEFTKVSEQLLDTKLEKSNNLQLIRKKKADLIQEIKAVRKRMNKHLDALEQKIIAELDAEQNQLEKEIDTEMKVADDLITASDQRKPDLTSKYDETQMFIIEKVARVVLTKANSFLKDTNLSKHPTLKFEQNDELCDTIKKSTNMGKLIKHESKPTRKQRSNYIVESKNDINVRVKSDNFTFGYFTCDINDMCQLPDGTILLIDKWNSKLKRLDDQNNVKDCLPFKAKPRGLCSVSATEVAVRLENYNVHFVSVGKSLSDQRQVSIKQSNSSWSGMLCFNNQLWISGDKAIHVYSLSGSLLKKIETDSHGRKIFPDWNPRRMAVSNDGTTVYVTAYGDRVVVFETNGDVITELRDQRLDGTNSVCITEDDVVLVAGRFSRNVVMFDRDNHSLGELVSSVGQSGRMSGPHSLCYDRQRCRLLVGCWSDIVHIFQLTG